jgi:hypothetical protein
MYLFDLVVCGSVLFNGVVRAINEAMIVFDFDEVMRSLEDLFITFIFSGKVKVEVVEEVWVFVTNVADDIEKGDWMENFDEVFLHGLFDMNDNFMVQFNQVSPELNMLHKGRISQGSHV